MIENPVLFILENITLYVALASLAGLAMVLCLEKDVERWEDEGGQPIPIPIPIEEDEE